MNLAGKTALVTGASRGIGRAISMELAAGGVRIAIHYHRDRQAAEDTSAALQGAGHTIVQADVAIPEAAQELVETVIGEFGSIDILINNAGIYEPHPFAEQSYESWQDVWSRTLAVNLSGAANVSFCTARHMIRAGRGRIVNISSRGAFRGEPQAPAYGASKAGLNAMSQSLAVALAPHNISVCVVAPGFVETDMAASLLSGASGDAIREQSPMGRVARPEEVARIAAFLASDDAEFLTGCIVDVNGASYLRS